MNLAPKPCGFESRAQAGDWLQRQGFHRVGDGWFMTDRDGVASYAEIHEPVAGHFHVKTETAIQ